MVSRHIGFSLLPAAGIFILTEKATATALFLAGAVLIDFDHYLDYVIKEKRLSPREAYKYNIRINEMALRRQIKGPLLNYFHTAEFFAFMLAASVFYTPLGWVFAGMVFHISLDVYEILMKFDPRVRSFSVIWSMRHRQGK